MAYSEIGKRCAEGSPANIVADTIGIVGAAWRTSDSEVIGPQVLRTLQTADTRPCRHIQGIPSKLAHRNALLGDVVSVEQHWTDTHARMGDIVSVETVRTVQSSHAQVLVEVSVEEERSCGAVGDIDASPHALGVSHGGPRTRQHALLRVVISVGVRRFGANQHTHASIVNGIVEVSGDFVTRFYTVSAHWVTITVALRGFDALLVLFVGEREGGAASRVPQT